jgi:hypothetical protein
LRRKLPLHTVKELFQDDTTKYEFHTRAWAFQDRFLSPRIIQYTKDELVWECKTRTRCECTLLDGEDDGKQYVSSSDFRTYNKQFESTLERRHNPYELWALLVNIYTGRRFTIDSDRLPALAGIAKELQSLTSGPYFAGLWGNDLPQELLWSVDVKTWEDSRRPPSYRAPSWSGAATEGAPIKLYYYAEGGPREPSSKVRILDIQCTPTRQDPIVQVSAGFLRVSGALVTIDREMLETCLPN